METVDIVGLARERVHTIEEIVHFCHKTDPSRRMNGKGRQHKHSSAKMVTLRCVTCGKEFQRLKHQVRNAVLSYCSRECRDRKGR